MVGIATRPATCLWHTCPVRVYLGSDHAGFELKTCLVEWLTDAGHEPVDCGPHTYESDDDYPPYVMRAAHGVISDPGSLGIVIGGSGNGEQIAANKVPGIRAVCVSDPYTAERARASNNAQIITIGSLVTTATIAVRLMEIWLQAEFSGGRSAPKVAKISEIERKYVDRVNGH